ncbi:MAG TPA: hypothetical protein VLV25_13150 [Steroidobacteraceae bacterium]|nr:hypothetical protein [Steroidobacteraceae bacterium]
MRDPPAGAVPLVVCLLASAAAASATALAARGHAAGRDLVMKGGKVYDPARIEAALGIIPEKKP